MDVYKKYATPETMDRYLYFFRKVRDLSSIRHCLIFNVRFC